MSGLDIFLIWYGVGLWGSVFWLGVYFENMRHEDWKHVAPTVPLFALLGPFAFIASFPV
jgi:hypothetical protein